MFPKIFSTANPSNQKIRVQDGSSFVVAKVKKLTGTTGANEGDSVDVAHGLTLSKILHVEVLVVANNGNLIPPDFTSVSEFEFEFFLDPTSVKVILNGTNSAQLTGNALRVLIIHEE